MKVFQTVLWFTALHSLLVWASDAPTTRFQPLKIQFDDLVATADSPNERTFLQALQQVGMVSITNIPNFKELKRSTLSWNMHVCSQESAAARVNYYPDGTLRRTLASHTVPQGAQTFQHQIDSVACKNFNEAAQPFRQTITHVTSLFASRLSSLLSHQQEVSLPLLVTPTNYSFSTLSDIVNNGEHLEHFHSYQRLLDNVFTATGTEDTIEWHTDQGLFLMFSPGRMIHNSPRQDDDLSTGFSIELKDGTQALVEFDDDDDLVVLLGDGVNQYINYRLPNDQHLRALPHTLTLPTHSEDEARVWYGRMVLPPSTAIHPQLDTTFGALRDVLVHASLTYGSNPDESKYVLTLGCSDDTMVARQLEETSCEADFLYCWHRCMRLTEYNVSEEICHEQGKEVFCVDPDGHLWDGSHGNFFPGCATNDTEIGGGTVMYMFGFRFFLDGERPFLNFFLEDWTLNTTAKFVGAMLAVFFLGVLVEAIVKLRQKVIQRARLNHWNGKSLRVMVTLLHGCQELFGFLLMLATMMYSVEFLLSAVVGLAAGHLFFSKIDDARTFKKQKDPDSNNHNANAQDSPETATVMAPLCQQDCRCSH